MISVLIYLFPAVMDMILSAVLFMATVSAAQKGLSASTVANLITTWAVVYMVMALLIGRVVNQRNAARILAFSCLAAAGLSMAFAWTSGIRALYALVALEGVAMAAFFVPFQVFMKSVDTHQRKSINYSVGLYTFSWSIGYAAGPFTAGLMWQHVGWRGSHLINAGAALLVGIAIWLVKHAAQSHGSARRENPILEPPPARIPADYTRMPDLAWMGWVFSGLGCLAARMIFGLFPSSGAAYNIPKFEQGLTLFILSGVQAFVGLWLGCFKWWMYRPGPIFLASLFGVGGMALFAYAQSVTMFYLAAACFGVYSGMFFFYLVFHSLVHPERSGRYVAVNEATVGLMSLAGPFLGGLVADSYALRNSYLLTAGMLMVAITAQAVVHALLWKPGAENQVPAPGQPLAEICEG